MTNAPVPPGFIIREAALDHEMTVEELAHGLMRTAPETAALLSGDAEIDSETASLLEDLLGVRAAVWLALERDYRVALAHQPPPAGEMS